MVLGAAVLGGTSVCQALRVEKCTWELYMSTREVHWDLNREEDTFFKFKNGHSLRTQPGIGKFFGSFSGQDYQTIMQSSDASSQHVPGNKYVNQEPIEVYSLF